jgi:hypothetical protein
MTTFWQRAGLHMTGECGCTVREVNTRIEFWPQGTPRLGKHGRNQHIMGPIYQVRRNAR